jgi:uncharacterized protein DUF839
MRRLRYAAVLGGLAGLLAVVTGAQADVITSKPNYLQPAAPGVVIKKILSTGDIIGDTATGYQMSGIPDGLGAYRNRGNGGDNDAEANERRSDPSGTFTVLMNHELGRSFPGRPTGVDTRISRLVVDRQTLQVRDAEYLFTGAEGFERFCSATLVSIFGRPWYFTGEEAIPQPNQPPSPAHDGSSIVMDPETGMWRETAHFGHLQHENIVPLRLSKWVFLTSEDDFRVTPVRESSYLYAYMGNNFNRTIRGREGSLYVWKADNLAKTGNASVVKGESVPGHFVPIPQSENTASGGVSASDRLKAAAAARNAFKFDRLEDIAARPDVRGRVYVADTGKPPVTLRGRVYQLDINPRDPTRATLKMVLNGDAPSNDDLVNPDNMEASGKVLVIQEDREQFARGDPNRVLTWDYSSAPLKTVARVLAPGLVGAPFNWESSGVINARQALGANWWLLDVQAHTLSERMPGPAPPGHQPVPNTSGAGNGEDGQLLAIFIPNSTGGGGDDDDDDDD